MSGFPSAIDASRSAMGGPAAVLERHAASAALRVSRDVESLPEHLDAAVVACHIS
jgi:hypothetical protein